MSRPFTVAILSDIHYASSAEQARGEDYEFRGIKNSLLRRAAKTYRHWIWLRHPLGQNGQLDRFLGEVNDVDCVIANGDYSCDSAFVGLSDDAARESAKECVEKLHTKFGERFHAV